MKKKIGIGVGIGVAVLVVIYMGFSLFFQSHFCFGTTIDGISMSGCDARRAEERIRREIDGYSLKLIEREGQTETIVGSSIGVMPEFDGEFEQFLKEQNGFAWPAGLFSNKELTLEKSVTFEEEALEELVDTLSCMQAGSQRRPTNAAIAPYAPGVGYTLISADYGTTVVREALLDAISESVKALAGELELEQAGCYLEPEVGDDNEKLLRLIEEMNRYVATTVTYEFGEKTELLDGDRISEWLTGEDGRVYVDEEEVLSYVKELGRTYNTAYKPKEFETSYGSTVTISNGFYGWRIDNEGEFEQLLKDLATGEAIVREPVYAQTANSHGDTDYGDSYVEINLTAQHLFLYKDGELVIETDFVSGNVARGNATPTGAFGLTYKTTKAVLRGEDYVTPVDYWMPFNGDVGMHDATWRRSFGGNIYKRNGSHGCINLPYSAAKTIYQVVDKGYAVLVYTLPGTESVTAQQQEAAELVALIDTIGPVTLESEPVITSARNIYNSMSDSARAYVTNYDVLVAAEAALAELKAWQMPQEEVPQW